MVIGVIEIFFGIMLFIKRLVLWLKKGINLFLLVVFLVNIYMVCKGLLLGDKELFKWVFYLRLLL